MLPLLVSLFAFEASGQMARVKSFSKYPGYTGNLTIRGSITIDNSGKGSQYTFHTQVTGGVPDAGHGIHVHSGVSCAAASLVGGHFWSPFPEVDPWNVINGTADNTGAIDSTSGVSFGYDAEQFVGHAMVIHDPAGTRTACGIIEDLQVNRTVAFESATLTTYPGYNGTLNASGTVEVWDLDNTSEIVNFRLKGVEASAIGGVHIHVGLSCANSSTHYWTPASDPDPWNAATVYTSNAQGVAEGSFKVTSGYLLSANKLHAVVIHDSNNTRIACGLLGVPAVVCPSAAIQRVFAACKANDFNSSCTQACHTSLVNLTMAFVAGSLTLADSRGCIDSATPAWVGGDSASLKARLNFNGVDICNTTAPTPVPSSAVSTTSVVAGLVAVFMSLLL